MRTVLQTLSLSCAVITLTACGTFSSMTASDKVDYKKSGDVRGPNLALPPDLITAQADRRYVVQDGTATMSEYNQAVKKSSQMRSNVLTGIPGMKIERDGDRRWLVVDKPATELYPQVKDFWQENGFLLAIDSPSTGIMETDWAENRAKIPQDFIRRTLGKVLDAVYSSGERDKFRTRVERTADGSTEITISHRGMSEEYMDASRTRTWWMPRASDPELENEFIKRLMVALGTDAAKADSAVASSASGAPSSLARAELQNRQGTQMILIREGGDVAWRRVGLTLDRSGFTVEDRDRSKGTYFVRFVDTSKEEPGFWRKLFGSAQGPVGPQRFRLVLQSESNTATWVRLLDEQGNPADTTDLGKRILGLLLDDLR